MKNKIKYKLSEPQLEFLTANEKNVALVAGFGSGKTQADLYRAFTTMFNFDRANLLYCAPTLGLINDIWYPKVESFLEDLNIDFSIERAKNIIKLKGCGKMYCRSMEHPERIIGFEVLDAYLDELDILPTEKAKEVYRKAKARCRQKIKVPKHLRKILNWHKYKLNQVLISTTPEGFKATYEMFQKKPFKSSRLIQLSTYDNLHNLPDDYIDELMDIYPAELIKAYIMGIFTNLTQGTVYNAYDRILNRSVLRHNSKDELFIGLDFNVGKMSAVTHIIRNGFPHAVDQITKVLDTPRMIYTIKEKYPNNKITIFPDSSGKNRDTQNANVTDIKLLKAANFYVEVDNSNPAVKDRVNSMNGMFCNAKGVRRYFVNDKAAPEYADCLEHQVYKNGVPDKQNDMDHLPDAGGYFISKRFGISRPSLSSETLRTS